MATKTQTSFTPSEGETKNAGGGFAFAVDQWTLLDRFLIMGSEANKYTTASQQALKHATAVVKCLAENSERTISRIKEVSTQNRSPNNDFAIFALVLSLAHGDDKAKKSAREALPAVVRTGTHMLHFLGFLKASAKWNRGNRTAVSRWYTEKDINQVAYQLVKYQQRDGWAQSDALRLAHPGYRKHDAGAAKGSIRSEGFTEGHSQLFKWVVDGEMPVKPAANFPKLIEGFEAAKKESDPKKMVKLIQEYGLTHEMIPNELKGSPEVWEALLQKMPMGAMVRNLGKMTSIELIKPGSEAEALVLKRLADEVYLKKSRIHPINVLSALKTYKQGHGKKGSLTWKPAPKVVTELNEAFYRTFSNVPATGKRHFVGLDTSASMTWGSSETKNGLTAMEAGVAMIMVLKHNEPEVLVRGYSRGDHGYGRNRVSTSSEMFEIGIAKNMHLDTAMAKTHNLPHGGTDCALPYRFATKNNLKVDVFINVTDNETNANVSSPAASLREYRQKSGIDAKQIVIAMSGGDFSIADPNDAGSLDIVGFDSAAPALITDFVSEGKAKATVEEETESELD